MALISISMISTIIDTAVTSDETIQTALRAIGNMTTVVGASVIPISNTKARVFVIYTHSG